MFARTAPAGYGGDPRCAQLRTGLLAPSRNAATHVSARRLGIGRRNLASPERLLSRHGACDFTNPGREFGIGERPFAGMGIRKPKSFQPPQSGLNPSRRRRGFVENGAQRFAKGSAERPAGSVRQDLRDGALDRGEPQPDSRIVEIGGDSGAKPTQAGFNPDRRIVKQDFDQ